MEKKTLAAIFLRTLFIHSSWNFLGMQNLGFAYSLIPLARSREDRKWRSDLLSRHMRPFSSHPYLTGAIVASVARLEEDTGPRCLSPEAVHRKEALMAPYAAVGDPFFWGGLRPFTSVAGVFLVLEGAVGAPLFFLLAYNLVHIWVRLRGFIEGYRDGNGGIDFQRKLALPSQTRKLKWCSTFVLSLLCAIYIDSSLLFSDLTWGFAMAMGGFLICVLFCSWLVGRGISSLMVLYGAMLFFVAAV